MSTDKSDRKNSKFLGWLSFVLVVVTFVGARQLHSGGIRGIVGDFIKESSSNQEIKELRDKMLASLVPVGAAAICLKEHGENVELREAVIAYNNRSRATMEKLVASVKAAGGMSRSEKDLLDRQAYQAARRLVEQDGDPVYTCKGLATRINSGEFDLDTK